MPPPFVRQPLGRHANYLASDKGAFSDDRIRTQYSHPLEVPPYGTVDKRLWLPTVQLSKLPGNFGNSDRRILNC